MKWVAFFSMTGSEIHNISQQLGRYPDAIITNRKHLEGVDLGLLSQNQSTHIYMMPNRPTVDEYVTALNAAGATMLNALVTLHGYLRVVPPEICESYNIVNGHPGLITTYPELKGKDPQARAVNYPIIGSVLHKVTAGVDEGPIIDAASCDNATHHIVDVTLQLKELSLGLWVKYLKSQLCI